MTRIRSRTGKRSAFTIIELMVVILIIVLLVSLVTAGVVKVLARIPETQTRVEISELATALQAFMTDYSLSDPPPSVLVLNEATPLLSPSGPFLLKVFGKNLGVGQPFVDWNGNGIPDGPWLLEGEQCLVFYTGGIPSMVGGVPTCLGFSTNNINPAMPGGKRKGPYFTFQSGRLSTLLSGSPFYVYLDPWKVKNGPAGISRANGWPYAYFSSNGINNGGYMQGNLLLGPPVSLNPVPQDCTSIGAVPYFTGSQFTNPNSYQIISAGQNGTFGITGWNPSNGAVGTGADDQTNFSAGLLGTGQR